MCAKSKVCKNMAFALLIHHSLDKKIKVYLKINNNCMFVYIYIVSIFFLWQNCFKFNNTHHKRNLSEYIYIYIFFFETVLTISV